ncbi:MAG TPA: fibrinogen-like YCDxxxxGGGW domain-containing protein [Polyangia bacterium]
MSRFFGSQTHGRTGGRVHNRARRGGRACGALLLAALVGLAACGERETLLQLDVVMPKHAVSRFDIVVGDAPMRTAESMTFPAAGATAGIDLLLPRRIRGEQIATLVARNGQGCDVAVGSAAVTIVPGEKNGPTKVTLEEFTDPVCDANTVPDGGAGDPPGAGPGDDAGRDAEAEPDVPTPEPEPGTEPDAAPPASDAPVGGDTVPARDVRPPDIAPSDAPRPPVDMGPPPPPACDARGACANGRNCVAGNVCLPAASCAQIKTQKPGAPDGVYWLASGTTQQQVYCDMVLGVVLCGTTAGEHQGRTRVGPAVAFKLSSQLDVAAGTCRIWAVRHATEGYPFDKIRPDTVSTCGALGFKAGDAGIKAGASINRSCPYGSNPPPFSDCGYGGPDRRFGGRGFYKWGNTCTSCSPVITTPGYFKQGPIFASDIHWDMSGRVSNYCNVR